MKNKKILISIGILITLIVVSIIVILVVNNNNNKTNKNDEGWTNEEKESQVEWSDFEISIDGHEYKQPFTIADFMNDGWKVALDYQDTINQTVAQASELSEEEKKFYTQNGIDVSGMLNPIYIELNQDNSIISFYIDNTQSDSIVKNANIINITTEGVDFKFYGVKNNFTIKEVQDLFGTKNYELMESGDNKLTNIRYYNTNGSVSFILDPTTELVKGIDIQIN